MKKIYAALVFILLSFCGLAQTTVYLRFINYNSQLLKTDGTFAAGSLVTTPSIDPNNQEFFKTTTFSQSVQQTLDIGSPSSGSGTAKLEFNASVFTRPVDAASPILFQNLASGTAYKTAEVFFTDPTNRIIFKLLYKLVTVKYIGWAGASCSSDCPGAIETVTIEYGGQLQFVYKSGNTFLSTPIIRGWNRVRNVADNDPNTVIQ
ncbi:MAG TPA: type VI secretion system tube protein Hcp [Puia sp.]|nr:type VI secretion system tube protein Hcp [Puia sp.]